MVTKIGNQGIYRDLSPYRREREGKEVGEEALKLDSKCTMGNSN